MLVRSACGSEQTEEQNEQDNDAKATETETSAAEVSSAGAETEMTDTGTTDMKMKLFIDDQEVSVEWENNEAVSALAGQVKAQQPHSMQSIRCRRLSSLTLSQAA